MTNPGFCDDIENFLTEKEFRRLNGGVIVFPNWTGSGDFFWKLVYVERELDLRKNSCSG